MSSCLVGWIFQSLMISLVTSTTVYVTCWTFFTITLSATVPPDLPLQFVFRSVLCICAVALESSWGLLFSLLCLVTFCRSIYVLFGQQLPQL